MVTKKHIHLPTLNNHFLAEILDRVNQDQHIQTLWEITNVTAINRLHMTDHGITHFQIVADNSLQMIRILEQAKIKSSLIRDYSLGQDLTEVVVVIAALFHDLGMTIHRAGHEEFSLFIANRLLYPLLDMLPVREQTIVASEILHAIISHRADGRPLTIEAGVVRVADALDMSGGRSRMPYDPEQVDIHSVSAEAINSVTIRSSKVAPIRVDIVMNHTVGLFQVDELLKKKVTGSGIERYVDIHVYIDRGEGKKLFKKFA